MEKEILKINYKEKGFEKHEEKQKPRRGRRGQRHT